MTISDIARLAGVSSSAVSRYFNDGYISVEKRESIRKVVEETGYRPSVSAQNLRSRKTTMIGVILPRIDSYSMTHVVSGILKELDTAGYHVMLAVTENDPKKELEYIKVCRDKQVQGIILSGTVLTPAHRRLMREVDIPLVLVGQQVKGHHCVYHDDYHSMYDMTKKILSQGRSRLGFIGVLKEDKAAGESRIRGFLEAVRDYGLPDPSGQVEISGFDIKDGYNSMENLYRRCPDLEGVICATDKIAVGAMQYLKEQKTEIPGQIVVTGHGDSELSRVTCPSLTTIHYYYEDSGALAARMLVDIMNHRDDSVRQIRMGYYLVERESTEERIMGPSAMNEGTHNDILKKGE